MLEVLLCTDHGKGKKGDYCSEGKKNQVVVSMALCYLFFGILETMRDICWLLKLGLEATACVYQSW